MIFSKIINSKARTECLRAKQKGNALRVSRGFTLIELLVVIGILAVLLAITLIAINPARQFAQANNTKRTSDINAILNAINQYMADNKGNAPPEIDSTDKEIRTGAGVGQADICSKLVTTYMAALPSDPKTGIPTGSVIDCAVPYETQYHVTKSATNNRITVSAVEEEPPLTANITVTR